MSQVQGIASGSKVDRPTRCRRVAWRNMLVSTFLLFCVYQGFEFKAVMDLMPTYLAAEFASQKQWAHVYHPKVDMMGGADPAWSARLRELKLKNHGTSFMSHPYYLTVARPLVALLDPRQFREVITSVNILLVAWSALEIAMLIGLRGLREQLLITLLVGLSTPVTVALHLGQNTLAALALSLAAMRAWSSPASPVWLGALFAAGAMVCKFWCASLLGACFLLRGIKPAALSGLALGLALGALPYALYPLRIMRDYSATIRELSRLSMVAPNNHAILATLDRYTWPGWVVKFLNDGLRYPSVGLRTAALSIAAIVGALAVAAFWRTPRQSRWTAACCLALTIVPLGVSWNHYFVFGLPLALLMAFGRHHRSAVRVLGFLLLGMLIALDGLITPFVELARSGVFTPEALALLSGAPMAALASAAVAAAWLAPGGVPTRASIRRVETPHASA